MTLLLRTTLIAVLALPLGALQEPSASVQGMVLVSGDRPTPVSGATVEVRRLDGTPPQAYVATTASDGTFLIVGIRPGQYRLLAGRNGYLGAEYGQRRPSQPGVTFTLVAGQRAQSVQITMTPGGIVHGRIHDRQGDPVGAAEVHALSPAYQDGVRVLKVVQAAITNDLGQYRLFDLPPGQYYVSATPTGGALPISSLIVNGSSSGQPIPVRRRQSEDLAETYLPHYYPGTADVRRASAVELGAGATFGGVDFIAVPSPTRHVRGSMRSGRSVSLVLAPLNPVPGIATLETVVDPDTGTFDFAGVAPGAYILVAKADDSASRQILDVGDGDLNNVGLALDSGFRIPGRLVIDDRAPLENDPDMDRIYFDVALNPKIPGVPVDTYSPLFNGTFALRDLIPGDYRLTLSLRNPGPAIRNAYLKSIRLGDQDVLNAGLRVAGPVDGTLEIVVGTRPGSLQGTVANDRGQPVENATVVLANDTYLRSRSDLYRVTKTDAYGRFLIDSLPPGNFKIFAWENVEETAWQDPEFMGRYEARGKAIRISENGRATVEAAVIP